MDDRYVIPPLTIDNKRKYFIGNHFLHQYYYSLFLSLSGENRDVCQRKYSTVDG